MIAVDKGITQTKDVVFVVRVALVVELKKSQSTGNEMCARKKQTNSNIVTSIMLWLK
jgi:hypothetical protein